MAAFEPPAGSAFNIQMDGLVKQYIHESLGADFEEKREPVSDIETAVVESLKTLDPNQSIREADIERVAYVSSIWLMASEAGATDTRGLVACRWFAMQGKRDAGPLGRSAFRRSRPAKPESSQL